jgi:hypothetical protein
VEQQNGRGQNGKRHKRRADKFQFRIHARLSPLARRPSFPNSLPQKAKGATEPGNFRSSVQQPLLEGLLFAVYCITRTAGQPQGEPSNSTLAST